MFQARTWLFNTDLLTMFSALSVKFLPYKHKNLTSEVTRPKQKVGHGRAYLSPQSRWVAAETGRGQKLIGQAAQING